MKSERKDKIKNQTRSRFVTEVRDVLASMRDNFPAVPVAMEYFYASLEERHTNPEGGIPAGEEKKVTIGTTCIQVPDELILALGARSVRLCSGSHTHNLVGAEQMPVRSCSLIRSTHGLLQTEELQDKLDMLVIPATCDQKKKAGEMLEDSGYNTHFLDLPSRRDTDHARAYWHESISGLTSRLEKLTGNRIKSRKLKDAVATVNRARQEFRRLHKLRGHIPPVIHGKDVFMITGAYSSDRIEEWTESLRVLNNELENKINSNEFVVDKDAPRLLFTGAPPIFPNLKVPLLAEQLGGVIVTDEVCSSSRLLYDAVSFDEPRVYDMLPAIADRYLKPCTCPYLVPNQERRDRILELVRSFQVDGVIYQAFSGCQLYEMEQRMVAKTLTESGISMLYIETDYSKEDMGQLSTRMEAFLESIRMRKRNSINTEQSE